MKIMMGGDWSIALNRSSRSVLSDARFLQRIGNELRAVYEPLVEEPVPDQLASILHRLEQREEALAE